MNSFCLVVRHYNGPYSEERQRYLGSLIEEGRSRGTLQAIQSLLYTLAQWLPLDRSPIAPKEIEATAERWVDTLHRSGKCRHTAKTWFIFHATKWLGFLGRLREEVIEQPFSQHLEAFLQFELRDRGLSPATTDGETAHLRLLLTWIAAFDTTAIDQGSSKAHSPAVRTAESPLDYHHDVCGWSCFLLRVFPLVQGRGTWLNPGKNKFGEVRENSR